MAEASFQHTISPDELMQAVEAVAENGRRRVVHVRGTAVDIIPHTPTKRARRRAPSPADIEAALSVAGAWEGRLDFAAFKRDLTESQWDDNRTRSL